MPLSLSLTSQEELGRTGLERGNVTDHNSKGLQNSSNSSGAESGASSPDSVQSDPNLQMLIDAWPDLPDAIKSGIIATVRALTEKGAAE